MSFTARARRTFLARKILFICKGLVTKSDGIAFTHSKIRFQDQPHNIVNSPFSWLVRWGHPICGRTLTKHLKEKAKSIPVSQTVAEGLSYGTCGIFHGVAFLAVIFCVKICLREWSMSQPQDGEECRTSNAKSLRSRRIEKSAGNDHPLFSEKKRKKDLNQHMLSK